MSFREKLESYAGGYPAAAAYIFHRNRGLSAAVSLANAKRDLLEGVARYPGESASVGPRDSDGVAFVVRPADVGLRFFGFADEIEGVRIEHTGWYTDDDGCNGMNRGAVYLLPARDGVTRLLAGYRTGSEGRGRNRGGWSDEYGTEVAIIDFSQIYESEARENAGEYCDAARSAALSADSMAESAAEKEREYQEIYAKGREARDAIDTAKGARAEARALLSELRGRTIVEMPLACKTLRARISGLLESARESYDKARELWREYGANDTFKDAAEGSSFLASLK